MENNKKNDQSSVEIIADFGAEFGALAKQDIAQLFVDVNASISPLDPLMAKKSIEAM